MLKAFQILKESRFGRKAVSPSEVPECEHFSAFVYTDLPWTGTFFQYPGGTQNESLGTNFHGQRQHRPTPIKSSEHAVLKSKSY